MVAGHQNLRGCPWIKGPAVLPSDVTTDSIYSLFQDRTTRERCHWDTNPAFGFLHIPPAVFSPVKEMKPSHAVLIATQWEAKRQPIHPRTSAQPARG